MNTDRRIKVLFKLATEVFGSAKHAAAWMDRPNIHLNDETPRDAAATRHGGAKVKDELIRIDYGVYH